METKSFPAQLVTHPRWSYCEHCLCEPSYLWMLQLWPLRIPYTLHILSVLILTQLPPCMSVWLWLIQLGSGSCSQWGKFTQLTADQLFSGVLHEKDHAAQMINNNRGRKRAVRMNMMRKKGFSVPQCPPRVSGDLILPHRIIDEAHSRKQQTYKDTRKLQIAGRGEKREEWKKMVNTLMKVSL